MKQRDLIFIFFGLLVIACNHPAKQKAVSNKYRARVFEIEINQFGYDVYQDSLLMIHQPTIPVIQGNKAFASREDAKRVADLMIYKLNNGISPPSITLNELDSLKIKE